MSAPTRPHDSRLTFIEWGFTAALAATGAQVVATSNIGCATQVAMHGALPVVHVIELLDWASGGPVPPVLAAHFASTRAGRPA